MVHPNILHIGQEIIQLIGTSFIYPFLKISFLIFLDSKWLELTFVDFILIHNNNYARGGIKLVVYILLVEIIIKLIP